MIDALIAQTQSLMLRCTGKFTGTGDPLCTFQDLINLVYRVVHLAVMILAPLAVLVAVIYGAFLIMVSGAQPAYLVKGKTTIFDAFVGLLIVWGAWAILNTVFYLVGIQLPCKEAWYQITAC